MLRERESSFTFVDNPPLRRESRGDMAVIAGPLRGADGASRGRLQAYFVATKSGNFERAFRGQVSGTLVLANGDIVLAGVTDDRKDEEPLAIVGGTGAYSGARGTAVVTDTDRDQVQAGLHAIAAQAGRLGAYPPKPAVATDHAHVVIAGGEEPECWVLRQATDARAVLDGGEWSFVDLGCVPIRS